jgi:hypothetical protein
VRNRTGRAPVLDGDPGAQLTAIGQPDLPVARIGYFLGLVPTTLNGLFWKRRCAESRGQGVLPCAEQAVELRLRCRAPATRASRPVPDCSATWRHMVTASFAPTHEGHHDAIVSSLLRQLPGRATGRSWRGQRAGVRTRVPASREGLHRPGWVGKVSAALTQIDPGRDGPDGALAMDRPPQAANHLDAPSAA